MRIARQLITATTIAACLIVPACSSDSDDAAATSTTPQNISSAAPTTQTALPSPSAPNYEPTAADTAAFVAAFRTGYPELSSGRRDNPIESLLENTCQEISVGKEPSIIVRNVGMRAEYHDVTPTPEQAQAIYELVAQFCPN